MKALTAVRQRAASCVWGVIVAMLAGCSVGGVSEDSGSKGRSVAAHAASSEAAPSHALVIVIDTLRADALERAQTPNIDTLTARGEAAGRAWSSGTWTVPSVVSMFTGQHVRQHGWDLPSAKIGRYPALPEAPTLAEVLADAGFETTGLYANPYLAEELGFSRGFDTWIRTDDASMIDRLGEHLAGWDRGRHFTYLHLLGPHSPLRPSEEAMDRHGVEPKWVDPEKGFAIGVAKRALRSGARQAYEKAYLAVVEDTDAIVGELLEAIEPWAEDTLIVLTSDHGELLGEHDVIGHGSHLWEPLTRVPFVVVNGGALPDTLVAAALPDVVTSALGVDHDWAVTRADALPLVGRRDGAVAFSPDGREKLIVDGRGSRVYDLVADPGEVSPAEITGRLAESLRTWRLEVPEGPSAELTTAQSGKIREELEALGYVEAVVEDDKRDAPPDWQ